MRSIFRVVSMFAVFGAALAPASAQDSQGLQDSQGSQGPIALDISPCFNGMAPMGTTMPVVVTLKNTGPSVDGAVVVRTQEFGIRENRYVYPLSLPSGTVKRLVTYPKVPNYSAQVTVSFDVPFRGSMERTLSTETRGRRQVGVIGDSVGGLTAVRFSHEQRIPYRDATLLDSYARPEDAPDRAAGYQSLEALVLTDGAERMTPAQWAAIRRWVMAGGSLVMLGGAGALYLKSPEVQPLLPLGNIRAASVPRLRLEDFRGPPDPPAVPMALQTGTLLPGATAVARQDGRILAAARTFGMGSVLYLAFNPLDRSFRGWIGQQVFWNTVITRAAPLIPPTSIWSAAVFRGQAGYVANPMGYGYTTGYGGPVIPYSRPYSSGPGVDPFQVQLPPLGMVAWILAAYFILVIPVTHLVLKRMRRLEWAWVARPALSIAFALVFYTFAAELYKAGLSRRTGGLLVAAAGQEDARFIGSSELFFPHGGHYRVEVPNAEVVESALDSPETLMGTSNALEVLDQGTATVPDLSVTNLSFRQVAHAEPVALGGTVTGRLRLGPNGNVEGSIHNGTGHDLEKAVLLLPGRGIYLNLGTIDAAQTAEVIGGRRLELHQRRSGSVTYGAPMPGGPPGAGSRRRIRRIPPSGPAQPEYDVMSTELGNRSPLVQMMMRQHDLRPSSEHTAYLYAGIPGEPFGPPLGRYVGNDSSVDFIVSMPLQ